MNYSRYFKKDQKVFLINISPERRHDIFESLTGAVVECGATFIRLAFSYVGAGDELVPFREGMLFKITSETFGVGVQLSARYEGEGPDGGAIFTPTGDLELFQRRQIPRFDLFLPLHAVRGLTTPGDIRNEWDRQTSICDAEADWSHLERRPVNLSAGGLRFETEEEVAVADLHLVEMDLEDGHPPVCAVAETVWTRREGNVTLCGNRFVRILKNDQQRLVRLIVDCLDNHGGGKASFSSNWEMLDRMIFSDV